MGADVQAGADLVVDVTEAAAVDEAIASVVGEHRRLDVVANVAGVSQFGRIEELTDDEWDRSLDVNLSGAFRVSRAAIPHLRATRGCIVNVASVAGIEGERGVHGMPLPGPASHRHRPSHSSRPPCSTRRGERPERQCGQTKLSGGGT